MSRRKKTAPKPLTAHQLIETANDLEALAVELRAEHATQIQKNLQTEIDAGYPATTSGAGNGGGSAASSRPEALTIRPDHTADRAITLVSMLTVIHRGAPDVLRGLRARDPNRKIQRCPRCNHPIPDGMTRCQRMITEDDGTTHRCGYCRETDCPRQGKALEVGEKTRNGRCPTCASRHYRAEKATVARPTQTGAVASVANLVDGMADIEVAD